MTSPRAQPKQASTTGCAYRCVHGYLCGRVSLLHVSVVCVLLGITLLVVGLVQLAPGAGEAPLPPVTSYDTHNTNNRQLWRGR